MTRKPAEACMEADELVAIGERMYGPWGWQRKMAQALEMNESTVRRWKTGAWPVNAAIAVRIRALDSFPPPLKTGNGDGKENAGRGLLRLALRAGATAGLVQRGDETGLKALDGSWCAWETDEQSIRNALALLENL